MKAQGKRSTGVDRLIVGRQIHNRQLSTLIVEGHLAGRVLGQNARRVRDFLARGGRCWSGQRCARQKLRNRLNDRAAASQERLVSAVRRCDRVRTRCKRAGLKRRLPVAQRGTLERVAALAKGYLSRSSARTHRRRERDLFSERRGIDVRNQG